MAEIPLPWFRFYHEAATDPKFEVVSMLTGIEWCAVFGAWSKILCIAASSPVRGSLYVTFQKRFSNDNVTAMLRFDADKSTAIMKAFTECDMLDLDEQGAYRVKNWGKRQYDSDNSTKRVREFRKRKDETLQKRDGNVYETNASVSLLSAFSDSSLNSYIPPSQEEKIYCAVTNYPTIPSGEIDSVLDRIAKIRLGNGYNDNDLIAYLRPFWQEQDKRYPGDTRAFWLDWAIIGKIPTAKKNGSTGEKPIIVPTADEIAKRRAEFQAMKGIGEE